MFNFLATHMLEPYNRIFIQIGPFTWYRYSLMIMIGLVTAILLGLREGKKLGITQNQIIDSKLYFGHEVYLSYAEERYDHSC